MSHKFKLGQNVRQQGINYVGNKSSVVDGLFEIVRQRRQFVGELEQHLQLVLALHLGELGDHLGQRRGHAHADPGDSPVATGTRTVFPHSVHDPS